MTKPSCPTSGFRIVGALILALGLAGCGGGGGTAEPVPPVVGDVPPPDPPPPPDPTPHPTPTRNIDGDLGLYLYQGTSGGFFSPVLGDFVDSATLSIIGIEWQSLVARPFAEVSRPDGSDVTLDMLVAGNEFYWVRDAGPWFSIRSHDARDGTPLALLEVFERVGPCIAVWEQQLFYANDDGFFLIEDFLSVGTIASGVLVNETGPCGKVGIFNVDDVLVSGDYAFPSSAEPRPSIEFWPIDLTDGTRQDPIARLQNVDGAFFDNADPANPVPRFALSSEGVYVAVFRSDRVDLWQAPFAAPGDDPTVTPQRLLTIDDPGQVDATLTGFEFRNLTAIWADDGYVAFALDFDRVQNGARTIEHRVVVFDTVGNVADVIDPGNDVFDMRLIHFD